MDIGTATEPTTGRPRNRTAAYLFILSGVLALGGLALLGIPGALLLGFASPIAALLMGASEGRLAEREQEVADILLAGGERAESDLLRNVTCGWIGRQGVVAGAITPLHDAFLRWLACGPGRRTGE